MRNVDGIARAPWGVGMARGACSVASKTINKTAHSTEANGYRLLVAPRSDR